MCNLDKCIYPIKDCSLCGIDEVAALNAEFEELALKADLKAEPPRCSDDEFEGLLDMMHTVGELLSAAEEENRRCDAELRRMMNKWGGGRYD